VLNSSPTNKTPDKVLIVDDEPSMRALLVSAYAEIGYEVFEASSEQEALALCAQQKPHLLVTDVRMPEGDGRTLVEKIRNLPNVNPVIFCMSSFRDMTPPEVFNRGIDQFFPKPLCLETLLSASKHFLSRTEFRLSTEMHNSPVPSALSELLQSLKDFLVVLGQDGIILECSHSFHKLHGVSPVGRLFSACLPNSETTHFMHDVWPNIANGSIESTLHNLRTPKTQNSIVEFQWTQGEWLGHKAILGLGKPAESASSAPENTLHKQIRNPKQIHAKMEMIHNAAMEARLQLHAIAGYASLLESKAPSTREHRFVQSILKNVSCTQNTLTDVIELAQN
jgi:CheY-like chemotaxis protein